MSLPSPAEIAAALIAREELPAEKGDIGPQGMDGKAGEFGPPGPQGAKGDPGRNGTNGSNGLVGPKGPQGNGGPRGPKGEKGDKGDEGERGPIGPMGPTGAVGSGKALFPRPGGGSGSGLPAGGAVGQVVTNTAPGTGTWQNAAGGDIEATLLQGDDAGGQEITNLGLVEVDVSADDGFADAIIVRVPDPADLTGNAYVFRVVDPLDNILLDFDAYGSWSIFGNALGGNVGGIQVFASGGPVVFKALTSGAVELGNGVSGVGNLQFDPAYPVAVFNQPVVLAHTTVPADADLFAGALALWYDKTNGAAEFEVKGKTANGTVVAQSFPIGVTPQTYAASNVTTDRTFDANATSIDELADVLGTLIADLRARKLVA